MDLTELRSAVHDIQRGGDYNQIVSVQAAITGPGGDVLMVGEWVEVEAPGYEDSYLDAVELARVDARQQLANKVADETGLSPDFAHAKVIEGLFAGGLRTVED